MAMQFRTLTSAQQSAAQQIYSRAYSMGGSSFANLALGVASGEGLLKSNPWSSNPDAGVTALGPFQLNLNSGVGSNFGLNANSPPSAQLNAALTTMYNGGNYNTGPWNAVGDTIGGGNNSAAGQSAAQSIGAQYASQYGLGGGSSGGVGDMSNPAQPYTMPGDTGGQSTGLQGFQNPSQPYQMPGGDQNTKGSVFSGMWEAQGVKAVTTAGQTVATATNDAAKKLEQDTKSLTDTLTATTKSATTTASNLGTGFQSTIMDVLTRGFIGFMGLVLLAGGVYYFTRPRTA
jgi:hypothetical protein